MSKTFLDKKGRTITVMQENEQKYGEVSSEDYLNIIAIHEGDEMGYFEFDTYDGQADFELVYMKSFEERCGIGKEMMRYAVEIYEDFMLPCTNPAYKLEFNVENYASEEGAALINYCLKNDILPERFKSYLPDYQVDEIDELDWDDTEEKA